MKGHVKIGFSVSVIIPTFNGERWLEDLLNMLERQTLPPAEVLIVDSGSADTTCNIAKRHNVRLEQIAQKDFDHGGTRSAAAGLVFGDILVYMTQDAIPAAENVLERLVSPLLKDEKIAATYGRQLAHKDATLFSEHLRSFNYPSVSEVRCWKDRKRLGFRTIFISNSFAAYRRNVLAAHGFFPTRLLFGEDTLTIAKFLENGYCVEYVSEACVYHSHNYSIWQEFKRYFDIGVFHVDQHEQLMKFGGPAARGKQYVFSELALILQKKKYLLLPESLLRSGCKFAGYNLGRHYRKLPRSLGSLLSMNHRWWSGAV